MNPLIPPSSTDITDDKTPTDVPVHTNTKMQLKRTKVKTDFDPLTMIKSDTEEQKKLAKEKKKRKLSSENYEQLFPVDDEFNKIEVKQSDTFPTVKLNENDSNVIQTGTLNTLSDFINSDVPLAVKENNTFDYNTKIKSVKGDFFTNKALIKRNCGIMEA